MSYSRPCCTVAQSMHHSATREFCVGNTIVTEADRKRTPAPQVTEGYSIKRESRGQKSSQERGTSTRNKKNPGKRPHQGG